MKNIVFSLIILMSVNLHAQRFFEVVKWEAYTLKGDKVFGIAPTMDAAELAIDDFQSQHKGKKSVLRNKQFRYSMIKLQGKTDNPYKNFYVLARKLYKTIEAEDVEALNIIDRQGFNYGVAHYQKVHNTNRDFAYTKLFELTRYYKEFLMNSNYTAVATVRKKM